MKLKPHLLSSTATALIFSLASIASGVVAGCGATDQAGDRADEAGLGSVQLALQVAPANGRCLRLTVDQPSTMLKVVRTVTLTPNTPSQTTISGLPVGSVGLFGEVFDVACASVVATTPLTWVSDRVPVTLTVDLTQTVTLTLRRAGMLNVGIDFVANPAIQEIKLSLPPSKIAAAPDGTMVMTMVSSSAFWRVSNAFDLKQVASTTSQPRLIATAPDNSVLVTTNNDRTVLVMTGSGALRATLTLNLTAGDILVDPAGFGWVGATDAPQIIRISNVQGLAAPTMVAITMPIATTPGLALAPEGTVRVGGGVAGGPGGIVRLTSSGSFVRTTPVPVMPRDLVASANDVAFFVSLTPGNNLWRSSETAAAQPLFAMTPTPTDAAIVNTPKGVVVAAPGGGLLLAKPDGFLQFIALPGNAVATSLAVSVADGRVWAGDAAGRRLLVVTLP
jgi:hypothetical protein